MRLWDSLNLEIWNSVPAMRLKSFPNAHDRAEKNGDLNKARACQEESKLDVGQTGPLQSFSLFRAAFTLVLLSLTYDTLSEILSVFQKYFCYSIFH